MQTSTYGISKFLIDEILFWLVDSEDTWVAFFVICVDRKNLLFIEDQS